MSGVPEDINSEIFSRLPVKSVLRATGVSSGIRDLIDDPNFVGKHLKFSSQRNPSLLLTDNRCREKGTISTHCTLYKMKKSRIITLATKLAFKYQDSKNLALKYRSNVLSMVRIPLISKMEDYDCTAHNCAARPPNPM
ncbi:hypothetical protein Vadar_015219 [Vaccinium darrowii]|uniref:Uncharacterized protein n=1 Tax=Vaccinium darrowii TaxID=229202 RepID=A0ACB7Z4D8_9ERIC|nr:hypothetical protein Vadar_015219 [Vaccinium darrowii]